MRRPGRPTAALAAGLVILAVAAFGAGFVAFAGGVARLSAPDDPRADGIVVLTGGAARIGTALRLLQEGRAGRLLISGVNPAVGTAALADANADPDGLLACCVDLGHEARDTIGNAAEAHDWVRDNGYRSLVLVTSDYHTPRALSEFGAAMPDIALTAYPVHNEDLKIDAWWQDSAALDVLVREYVKFLVTRVRLLLV